MSKSPKAAVGTARNRNVRRGKIPSLASDEPFEAQARYILELLFLYIYDAEQTLDEVARGSRVSASALKKWKQGKRLPTLIDATKCFAHLGYVLHPRFIGKHAIKLDHNTPRHELQGFDWLRLEKARERQELKGEPPPEFGSKEWQESAEGQAWIEAMEAYERRCRRKAAKAKRNLKTQACRKCVFRSKRSAEKPTRSTPT